MVISEFGRTSGENGSKGRDHGKAGLITLLSPRVKGGVRNCDSVVWGDNQNTLFGEGIGTSHYPVHVEDYRAVYAELSQRLFGIRNTRAVRSTSTRWCTTTRRLACPASRTTTC